MRQHIEFAGLLVCLSRCARVLGYGGSSGHLRSNIHRSPDAPGRGCDIVWHGPQHDPTAMADIHTTSKCCLAFYFASLDDVDTLFFKIDSLVPNYGCPNADAIRAAYQSVPAWTDHLVQYQDLQQRLDTTLGTTGLSAWNSWCAYLLYGSHPRDRHITQTTISLIRLPHALATDTHFLAMPPARVFLQRMLIPCSRSVIGNTSECHVVGRRLLRLTWL